MSSLEDVLWGLLIYDLAMGVEMDRETMALAFWALVGAVVGVLLGELLFRRGGAAGAGVDPEKLEEELSRVADRRADGSPGAHSVTPEREREAAD